jgi:putative acetyltransferase
VPALKQGGNQTAGREKDGAVISIREEWPEAIEAIRFVNEKAFGRPDEAILADALRGNQSVLLSLVTAQNDRVVGHILYRPGTVAWEGGKVTETGLGPMAVLPGYRPKGSGGALIETGSE